MKFLITVRKLSNTWKNANTHSNKGGWTGSGKGVIIAEDFGQASRVVKDMIENRIFGEAGKKIIIEEF